MKICVIGGTGHIGKFLVPMLVKEGHDVTVLTSGRTPLPPGPEWSSVTAVRQGYGKDEWTESIRQIRAEVLVDILQGDSPALYEAVKSTVRHFVVCGSVWMFGEPRIVPTPDEPQNPCLDPGYARRFQEMQAVKARAQADGIAFSAIMPPNICGPYKIPLDCHGGRSLEVHRAHQRGEEVVLPAPGNNLIGPCDAEDVAQGFFCAVQNREAAAGEIFNVGSAYALTAQEFVETYAQIYRVKIPIRYVGWEQYVREFFPEYGAHWHFQFHMCPDLAKIRRKLGYTPRHTPQQSMERAVQWMKDKGMF